MNPSAWYTGTLVLRIEKGMGPPRITIRINININPQLQSAQGDQLGALPSEDDQASGKPSQSRPHCTTVARKCGRWMLEGDLGKIRPGVDNCPLVPQTKTLGIGGTLIINPGYKGQPSWYCTASWGTTGRARGTQCDRTYVRWASCGETRDYELWWQRKGEFLLDKLLHGP
ncbi:hypothetical protein BC826DRAFT_1160283 [Russula brevipes]|nr:hypothetical protein BC826DRAFT_1160283 [Russula brevipes]